MRVCGRSEPLPPSYTRCARSISISRPFNEGIHLERLTLRKPAALEPSAPSGNPTSRTLFLLLLSSISVIFSVSRSSWFPKSVTALLSSRAAAWTESTRSRVCFAAVAIASSSSLSSFFNRLVGRLYVLTQFSQCWNQHSVHRISYCQIHNRIQSALLLFKHQLNAVSNSIVEVLSGDGGILEFFLHWRLLNLSFPIAFFCRRTHDGSNVEWFEIYWQDYTICGNVSRAKD